MKLKSTKQVAQDYLEQLIHNSPVLKTQRILSTESSKNGQTLIYPDNKILLSNKNEHDLYPAIWMNLKTRGEEINKQTKNNTYANQKKHKNVHTTYMYIYI